MVAGVCYHVGRFLRSLDECRIPASDAKVAAARWQLQGSRGTIAATTAPTQKAEHLDSGLILGGGTRPELLRGRGISDSGKVHLPRLPCPLFLCTCVRVCMDARGFVDVGLSCRSVGWPVGRGEGMGGLEHLYRSAMYCHSGKA